MSRPGEPAASGLAPSTVTDARRPALPPAPPVDEERFAEDLGLMLRSGLSLMDSLDTLRGRGGSGRPGANAHLALDRVVQRLKQGETLSQAMAACGGFRAGLLACVRASERTGDMVDSLQRFAANAARARVLRARLVSALVYPALLVAVAGAVVVFLLVFVVPRFALVLESSGHDVPMSSQALIAVGRALHGVPALAWLAVALAGLWGCAAVVRAARERRLEAWLTDLAARIPGPRDVVRTFGQSQFVRSGAMLVRSGVPALKALRMCRELLAGADRAALDRALDAAASGASLSGALHQQQLVDGLGLRVLRVAEQTGALEAALERLADVHDRELERTLDRVSRLVEPLLMLGIGLVVGGIVVLMYLPIFQLAASI
jgi:general secretion pathway protein F